MLAALLAGKANAAESISSKAPAWTAQDSLDGAHVVALITKDPQAIDSLTNSSLKRDHELGFGRKLREAWVNPAGKLGFAFKVFYTGKTLVSFEARPIMNYGGLRARYLAILVPAFKTSSGDNPTVYPYQWNLSAAAEPLPRDSLNTGNDSLLSPAVKTATAYYMTPFSGTLYGIKGGEVGQILENRDQFLGIEPILLADKKLARYLLRSVNPATRLTVVEFMIRHKAAFPDFDSLEAKIFPTLYSHPAKAATMRGSLESAEDSRKLVLEFSRQEAVRNGRGVLRMY